MQCIFAKGDESLSQCKQSRLQLKFNVAALNIEYREEMVSKSTLGRPELAASLPAHYRMFQWWYFLHSSDILHVVKEKPSIPSNLASCAHHFLLNIGTVSRVSGVSMATRRHLLSALLRSSVVPQNKRLCCYSCTVTENRVADLMIIS